MAFVDLQKAIALLSANDVVALPTETVYGLAGRIDSDEALNKIFEVKKRPFFDPLIVHLSESMSPTEYVLQWPELYVSLTKKFWPGPLTLIAAKNNKISDLITSGLSEVALRSPNHPLFQKVLSQLKVPLAAPSANLFGKTSPTTATHVENEFSGAVHVLDGGPCQVGLESTVVRLDVEKNTLQILRPGLISETDLLEVCAPFQILVESAQSKVSPGHLKDHYQPKAPLLLLERTSTKAVSIEELRKTHPLLPKGTPQSLDLTGSPTVVARRLYSELRRISEMPNSLIVAEIHRDKRSDPNWTMIWDRLEKASSFSITV